MRLSRRRGMTVLEVLVAMGILALVLAGVGRTLRFSKLSKDMIERLDLLQQLRLAEVRLGEHLRFGTAILHPRSGAGAANGLVFTDGANKLRVVYREDTGRIWLKADGEDPELICTVSDALVVEQPVEGQALVQITATAENGAPILAAVTGYFQNSYEEE